MEAKVKRRCLREEITREHLGSLGCERAASCYLSFALRVGVDDFDKSGDLFVDQLVHLWIVNDRLSECQN